MVNAHAVAGENGFGPGSADAVESLLQKFEQGHGLLHREGGIAQ